MENVFKIAIPASALALSASAHAALPAGVTEAITEAGADLLLIMGAVLLVGVGIYGVKRAVAYFK